MKFLVILMLTILHSVNTVAQDYFNKLIPFEFGSPTSIGLYKHQDKFIIPVIYPEEISTLIVTDGIDHNYIHHSFFDYSKAPVNIIDDNIFLFAKDRTQAKSLKLAKLDAEFQFDWQHEINTLGTSNFPTGSCAIGTEIYNSFTFEDNGIKKIGINKINSVGTEQWTKYFESNIGYSYLWQMMPSKDNNLIFSYTIRYEYQPTGFPRLMKIDAEGNEIWKTDFFETIHSGAAPVWIAELSDSSIVQTYEVYRWNDPEFLMNDWTIYVPRMIWFDKSGNKTKEIYLNTPNPSRIYIAGLKRGKGDYFFAFGNYKNDTRFGLITKYNNQGDTLWTHQYTHPQHVNGSNSIRDIVELDNGDILALGEVSNPDENLKIWLFKVNAAGCFSAAPCADIVSATSPLPAAQDADLSIYPNPTVADLHIELAHSTIDQLTIFDGQGRLLQQVEVNQQQMSLNIRDWADGLYILQVIDIAGKVYVDKFVKE